MAKKKRTDEDLWKDIRRTLQEILKSNEPSTVVMRGHILIDNLLASLLDGYLCGGLGPFKDPPFEPKVRLAYAVGLLNDNERTLLMELNAFRNRVGHRLDGQLSAADEERIRTLLTKIVPEARELTGVQVYQWFITMVFAIILVRGDDIAGLKPPVLAEAHSKAYTERVVKKLVYPVLLAIEMTPETLLVFIILGLAAVFANKVPISAPDVEILAPPPSLKDIEVPKD